MVTGNNIKLTQEHIKNAKEFYDYYINIDSARAAFYKQLMELDKEEEGETKPNLGSSAIVIKDLSLSHVVVPLKRKSLRQRTPRNGFNKTVAEIIEEILIEKDKPLTAKELLASTNEKGRKLGELKDFSSQLISISKNKNRFFKVKINNVNFWGLSEWGTGIDFKRVYKAKIN